MTPDIADRAPLPPPVLTLQPGRVSTALLPDPSAAAVADRVMSPVQPTVPPTVGVGTALPESEAVTPRRLLPLVPLRALVSLSLLAVAVGSGYLALLLTVLRTTPQTPQSVDGFVDDYVGGSLFVAVAYLLGFVLQGAWSVAQAWNTRRTNLLAPRPTTLLLHFLVGPLVVLASLPLDGWQGLAVFIMGLLLTYALWARSFSVMRVVGQMVDANASRLTPWGLVMGLHVVVWLLGVPAEYLSPDAFFYFWTALLALQMLVFGAAAVTSWIAMAELDRATRSRPQIRRAA